MCQRRADGETFEAIAKAYGATLQNTHSICSRWGPKNGFPSPKHAAAIQPRSHRAAYLPHRL